MAIGASRSEREKFWAVQLFLRPFPIAVRPSPSLTFAASAGLKTLGPYAADLEELLKDGLINRGNRRILRDFVEIR
jgi:hypothetical protein